MRSPRTPSGRRRPAAATDAAEERVDIAMHALLCDDDGAGQAVPRKRRRLKAKSPRGFADGAHLVAAVAVEQAEAGRPAAKVEERGDGVKGTAAALAHIPRIRQPCREQRSLHWPAELLEKQIIGRLEQVRSLTSLYDTAEDAALVSQPCSSQSKITRKACNSASTAQPPARLLEPLSISARGLSGGRASMARREAASVPPPRQQIVRSSMCALLPAPGGPRAD